MQSYLNIVEDVKKQNINDFAGKYRENKFLDFKSKHPLECNNSRQIEKVRKEFVVDIASFANTSGGYLIYGVKESDRIPVEFTPFKEESIEELEITLGQLINKWSEPHIIGYKFYSIQISKDHYILVVSISKTVNSPHGIKAPGEEQYTFCGRTEEGNKYHYKHSMLKESFIRSSYITERIKLFCDQRINKILVNDAPVPIGSTAKIVMHCIPLSAFDSTDIYDLEYFYSEFDNIIPMYSRHLDLNRRRNFDGILVYLTPPRYGSYHGYTQLYRNGVIESVDSYLLEPRQVNSDMIKIIDGDTVETTLIKSFIRFSNAIIKLGIVSPIYFAITITEVNGYKVVANSTRYYESNSLTIDRDILQFPGFEIFDLKSISENAPSYLKQSFDLLWAASNIKCSPNYDNNGMYKKM